MKQVMAEASMSWTFQVCNVGTPKRGYSFPGKTLEIHLLSMKSEFLLHSVTQIWDYMWAPMTVRGDEPMQSLQSLSAMVG